MSGKSKDIDYVTLSAQIRAMENRLLTRERMERMLEARTDEETARVLAECGYGEAGASRCADVNALLADAWRTLCRELKRAVPDPRIVEVFQMKYDYHNAKVLLKAQAMGIQADRLLSEGGRWSASQLRQAIQRDGMRECTGHFRTAVEQARETLNAGGDPQLADFVLDRAYFQEMTAAAAGTGSAFLQNYLRLLIDAANLRAVVRALRMGKGPDFLRQVLLDGGTVAARTLAEGKAGELSALFRAGPLASAAALGEQLTTPGSGALTAFERACDDGVTAYVEKAKRIPFGAAVVIGYLYARESEMTAIRTILSGRRAGLDADVIRERLREAYV